MKSKKMPAPRRAGTLTADEMLARIGDDPETLILAIRLLERANELRSARRRTRRRADSY